jgi:hypothetical protein
LPQSWQQTICLPVTSLSCDLMVGNWVVISVVIVVSFREFII